MLRTIGFCGLAAALNPGALISQDDVVFKRDTGSRHGLVDPWEDAIISDGRSRPASEIKLSLSRLVGLGHPGTATSSWTLLLLWNLTWDGVPSVRVVR